MECRFVIELMGIDYGQGPKMAARLAQNIKEAQIKLCDDNTPTVYQDILIQTFVDD
jgi:hypothetical protein